MSTPEYTADPDFDTLRALIYEYGPREAQRIARGIARGLDALSAFSEAL